MQKTYKNCQSCGMPLSKDPHHGGTEADGRLSAIYCSYCFEKGKFLQPHITAVDMTAFVKTKLKEMGFPGWIAGLFARGTPKLERWKTKK